MRKSKMEAQQRKRTPIVRHTKAERDRLKKIKRKTCPSALRRAAKRHSVIQTLECGCKVTKYQTLLCDSHKLVLGEN